MRRTRSRNPDPFLDWKVAIFFLAAGIWLAGVISNRIWMSGAAILLLLVGILLRFLSRRRNENAPDS